MKRNLWLWLGIVASLLIAVVAYFWATGLLDSLYYFRSPLHNSPPAPGQALGVPNTRRVVFVLLDGLRLDTSLKPDVMPFLNELRSQGASATMHSRPPSYSEPGYTVLLTGAWPDLSDGPTINLDYDQIPTWTQDNLFSAASRLGLKTAVSGFYWFEKLIPQAAVNDYYYTPGEDQKADRAVVDQALPWLVAGNDQLVLIHIDQVDYAGHHEGGPIDPRWDQAAKRSDDLLRQIAGQLDLSQDTLFVASDHGHIDRGGHGGQDAITLIEPFVLVGKGVKPGQYPDVNMVDVAPTLAVLLGSNLPATSQGRALVDMLELSPQQIQDIQAAETSQQSTLLAAYESAMGRQVQVPPGPDPVTSTQEAIASIRSQRLQVERFPRSILALILAIFPAVIFFRERGKAGWRGRFILLLGAIIYLVVFNLRYAVVDRRTYSLSSVTGATDLILYTATTAFVAYLLAWMVIAFGLRIFQRSPSQAAGQVMGLTFTILYLLALPVLWSFSLNGVLVGWDLPDFASTFLAFLSLVQILMVSIFGLLFTALAAAIVSVRRRSNRSQPVAANF